MTTSADLWLYFLLVLGIIALPGMDMAYVVANTVSAGTRGAVAAVSGIVAGGMIHTLVGATGVAAMFLQWPRLLPAVTLLGAAYLAWMGLQLLRIRPAGAASPQTATASETQHGIAAIFRYAVLTCLLNPKAYAFMLAVFPGFLYTQARPVAVQAMALGGITAATQIAVYGAAAFAAMHLHRRLGGSVQVQVWMPRCVGLILIATAALLAFGVWPQA